MQRLAPVLVLAVLATVVPEVLFGSTPLTEPGRILATMPIYAGGAVVIRELARRRRSGWLQIAMLGVAFGIVEEGLALGSLFSPTLFNAALVGGRLFGVNWTWTEWTLGYHAVWSISIPIALAELTFHARRQEPWLGTVGLVVAGLVFAAGAVFLALVMRLAVTPDYAPPLLASVVAGLVVVVLAALALARPSAVSASRPAAADPAGHPPEPSARVGVARAPSAWLVGLLSLVTAAAWFGLLVLPGPVKAGGWVVVPMTVAGLLLVALAVAVRRWSAPGRGWTDLHRLALVVGPLPVHVSYGLAYVTAGSPSARAYQAAAFGLTIVLLFRLARRLHIRDDEQRGPFLEARAGS
ncbi:MAG: hypothetical protein U0893_25005 [Chloroflexota bacterium]